VSKVAIFETLSGENAMLIVTTGVVVSSVIVSVRTLVSLPTSSRIFALRLLEPSPEVSVKPKLGV
jgi:hypothetical protein